MAQKNEYKLSKVLKILYLAGPRAFDLERVESMMNHLRYRSFFDYSMLCMGKFSIDVDYLSPNSWGLLDIISQSFKVIAVLKKYDIIITSTATGFLLAFLRFLRPWKKPCLLQIRWQLVASMKGYKSLLDKIWIYIIRKNVDMIICVSSLQKKLFSETLNISKSRISYVPIGIDTEFFKIDYNVAENNYILCVGLITLVFACESLICLKAVSIRHLLP